MKHTQTPDMSCNHDREQFLLLNGRRLQNFNPAYMKGVDVRT